MITGSTNNSRLAELRKYVVSGNFVDLYWQSHSPNVDGLNPTFVQRTTYPHSIVYYIGNITYTDIVQSDGSSITIFEYMPNNNGNFINESYIQNPNSEMLISKPKIYDDVFIIRDNLSAFEMNYKLEFIDNLADLMTYASGKYFNIINNT